MNIPSISKIQTVIVQTMIVSMMLCTAAPSTSAAVISWGNPTTIAADSDVDTSGLLVGAWNIGDTGVTSTTVNGVIFSPLAAPDSTTIAVNSGALTVDPSPGEFKSTNIAAGLPMAPFNTLSSSYQELLQAGTANPNSSTLGITLSGLTIGSPYLVQIWVNDSDSYLSGNPHVGTTIVQGGPILDVNSTNAPGGVGQYVTGTFNADAITQQILLSSGAGHVTLNALQLRAIPEPSYTILALVGCALLAIITRPHRSCTLKISPHK